MNGRSDESLETRALRGGRLLRGDGDHRDPRRAVAAEDDGDVSVVLRRIRPGARRRIAGQVPWRHGRKRFVHRHRARPSACRGRVRAGRGSAQRSRTERRRQPEGPAHRGPAGAARSARVRRNHRHQVHLDRLLLDQRQPDRAAALSSARQLHPVRSIDDEEPRRLGGSCGRSISRGRRPARRRARKDQPHPGGRRFAPSPRRSWGWR